MEAQKCCQNQRVWAKRRVSRSTDGLNDSGTLGQRLLPLSVRMRPFKLLVCPGSVRSGQRRAKALLNRHSPGRGRDTKTLFHGRGEKRFGVAVGIGNEIFA
jgi:hypothetical protein